MLLLSIESVASRVRTLLWFEVFAPKQEVGGLRNGVSKLPLITVTKKSGEKIARHFQRLSLPSYTVFVAIRDEHQGTFIA